jgi:uncharacterized membrane protein YkvA (DUF1232 family)
LNTRLRTQDVAVIGIAAALYAIFGILTANFNFLGIGFLPAVVIPAIFAALYGPWVGGLSGAIGIFIRDIFVHGNAALSLVAGVPANFLLFFIIGYIYTKNISLKQTLIGVMIAAIALLVPTIVFLPDVLAYTGLSSQVLIISFSLTVILSLAVISLAAIRWKQWRSYTIGAVVGQAVGAGLLSVTVWLISPLFLSFFNQPLAASLVFPIFVWTFATELPFILVLGPIVIGICYRAFPALRRKENKEDKP